MKSFIVFVTLLSVSCCAKADDTTYRCICNNVDKGRCETVYIKHSEKTWYVNFYFKGVMVLKSLNECRVDGSNYPKSNPIPSPTINLSIGRL